MVAESFHAGLDAFVKDSITIIKNIKTSVFSSECNQIINVCVIITSGTITRRSNFTIIY